MDTKNFGQKLKALRGQKGLTQVEMSQKLKCNYRHYQEIESGRVDIRHSMLIKILNVLDAAPSLLIENSSIGVARVINMGIEPVLDQIIEPVNILDTTGKLIYLNPAFAKAFRVVKEDVMDKVYGWDVLTDEAGKQKLKDTIAWVLRDHPVPFTYDVVNPFPDGSVLNTNFNWNYLYQGKNLLGFISVAVSKS